MQVIVDGLLTTYERTGEGKQVLILHGWADPAANWRSFAAGLAKYHEVIVPDLPGFGGTQAPLKPWGLNEYVTFIAQLIKKLKLKPTVIIGHSNGAAIAIRGLATGHLSAERLVLLAAAGIRGEYKGRNGALRAITKTGKLLSAPLPDATKRHLRRKVYQTVGSDMLVSEHLQATFKKIVEDDVRADAARLKVPTLLVYGERDDQTPVRYGEIYHEAIDNSTFEVLPQADHFLYRAEQAEVIKRIEEFLNDV